MAPTAQGPTYFYRRVWNKVKRTLLKRKNTFWSKKNFKANEHLHARLRLLVRSPSTHTHTHTHSLSHSHALFQLLFFSPQNGTAKKTEIIFFSLQTNFFNNAFNFFSFWSSPLYGNTISCSFFYCQCVLAEKALEMFKESLPTPPTPPPPPIVRTVGLWATKNRP